MHISFDDGTRELGALDRRDGTMPSTLTADSTRLGRPGLDHNAHCLGVGDFSDHVLRGLVLAATEKSPAISSVSGGAALSSSS